MPRCPTSNRPRAFNAHSPGDGGERFSPTRFSLTGAHSSRRIHPQRTVRRAAKRKTLYVIEPSGDQQTRVPEKDAVGEAIADDKIERSAPATGSNVKLWRKQRRGKREARSSSVGELPEAGHFAWDRIKVERNAIPPIGLHFR